MQVVVNSGTSVTFRVKAYVHIISHGRFLAFHDEVCCSESKLMAVNEPLMSVQLSNVVESTTVVSE